MRKPMVGHGSGVIAFALLSATVLAGCQTNNPLGIKPAPAIGPLTEQTLREEGGQTHSSAWVHDWKAPRHESNSGIVPNAAARTVALGYSILGKPITMHVFGTARNPALIFAGIHGDEPASSQLARRMYDEVRSNPSILGGRSVAFILEANPDGLAARTRGNANRVDCNRNFPANNWKPSAANARYSGGPRAASEPETQAIMKAVDMLHPCCIVTIHTISGRRFCNNYDGPASALAAAMSRYNNYPPKATIGYPTPGSFGTWSGVDRGIPTITLELPDEQKSPSQWWPGNRQALLTAIRQNDGLQLARDNGRGGEVSYPARGGR
ncbi:MAG: DUF2817 domain-containing protein [Planctomycetaceae bacterium]|nr:DUF2817 domain-containing protein [Planctomycetaceae bacterium]